jgi:hypothetical protein
MAEERFSAEPVLAGLKDFQRRTVDYVFDRLYGRDSTSRFLVADEVGLGKTLVARGLIARALEHIQDKVERADIIYVCSNAAIAAQNINRLNVSGQQGFALASRLTFLPMQVKQFAANKVNFVSFTPGTTFDLKSRGGRVEERALIYKMLRGADWDVSLGLLNMLQASVQNSNWERWAKHWEPPIDEALAAAFRTEVNKDTELVARLNACCTEFRRFRKHVASSDSAARYELIGELRYQLAKTCLHALEPDLVILDEFQRFKDLLNGDDDAALLARELFSYPESRTLLLSATPYKMLSLDHEQDDDHYPDFLNTLRFLFQGEDAVAGVRREIQEYRNQLFALTGGGHSEIGNARDCLQQSLLRVMCRTERVGMTQRLDAMLTEPPRKASLCTVDLDHAAMADRAARAVGACEPIEYWKSSPYLLNFLKHYDLRRRIDEVLDAPPDDLLEALRKADGHILTKRMFEEYQTLDPACARMRVLFEDTLEKGMWRLLWMPPSLSYSQPAAAYADVGDVTKSLVFSSWNLVPDAIAALCSYEAERRMTEGLDKSLKHSDLYDRLKPLLRFTKGSDDRLTGMPVVAWLLPSTSLANALDPLVFALRQGNGEPISADALVSAAESCCKQLIDRFPKGGPGSRADERWYWAAPAMLEHGTHLMFWAQSEEGWVAAEDSRDPGSRFRDHVAQLVEAAKGNLDLGPQPDDLARVLAEMAVAAPGVCALRALRRVSPNLAADDHRLLSAAARIAGGFRTLFNLPETVALLRGSGEESYWRRTLQYGIDGNIQAVLDEQIHVLLEQLGLSDHEHGERVEGISRSLADSLSIRTAQIRIDELKAQGDSIERSDFNTRCRFALRFGELRDDSSKTVARADAVREAFNSPFRPFVLASTSIGQEGLDFHTWCHAVVHWNLPSNPVDLEQREGRVHRYKGHAVRKNIGEHYGLAGLEQWDEEGDPWAFLFRKAKRDRLAGSSDLVPFWIYEQGSARIERRVPLIPFSREVGQLHQLKKNLALYRLVFGQPRQEDLLAHISHNVELSDAEQATASWRISLQPPEDDDESSS